MNKTKATEAALLIWEKKKIYFFYFFSFLADFSGSASGVSSLSGVG